jgi:hypothetical protein
MGAGNWRLKITLVKFCNTVDVGFPSGVLIATSVHTMPAPRHLCHLSGATLTKPPTEWRPMPLFLLPTPVRSRSGVFRVYQTHLGTAFNQYANFVGQIQNPHPAPGPCGGDHMGLTTSDNWAALLAMLSRAVYTCGYTSYQNCKTTCHDHNIGNRKRNTSRGAANGAMIAPTPTLVTLFLARG